jgi:flagellar hook-associated protein 3 FlgL
MRITTAQFYQRGVDSMLDQQSKLSDTQQQVATGLKYLTPSDNPAAAARSLELNLDLGNYEQYQKNIDHADSRLGVEDSVLDSMVNQLQRVRELAIQGNNGALGADERKAIAFEARQILDEMVSLANTQDANGEYYFAGHQGQTQPVTDSGAGVFTYNGDQGQRFLKIGESRQVAINDSGEKLFFDIPASAGGTQSVFTTVYGLITDLESNNFNSSTADLDNAMENILQIRADLGARLNALDNERDLNDTFALHVKQNLSDIQDLDYAEAVSRLNQQLTALQASQQAFIKIQGLSLFNYLR